MATSKQIDHYIDCWSQIKIVFFLTQTDSRFHRYLQLVYNLVSISGKRVNNNVVNVGYVAEKDWYSISP